HHPDPWRRGELLDRRRLRRRDEEAGIDGPLLELLQSGLALGGHEDRGWLVGARGGEDGQRQRARAALRPADGDAAALELARIVDRISPVEDPERNVGQRAQRDDVATLLARVG